MPMINFTNPFAVLVGVILFVLVLVLGKETKKPWIVGAMLIAFCLLLIAHTVEYSTAGLSDEIVLHATAASATFDLVFIFLSFMTYLWVDDMAVKEGKRKSIDNSLDWFWNKI